MKVRKIAVLRANAVGDFIFALPALEAVRAAYPSAEIVLLGLRWHRVFLEGRPSPIDRVIEVPASRGINEVTGKAEDPNDLNDFFQRMAAERFDIALQLHGGPIFERRFISGGNQVLDSRSPFRIQTFDAPECGVYFICYFSVLCGTV